MSLRYALLALLTAMPMTGYDLTRTFRSSVGHVWHAPDSQIYPELKKMLADGLVAASAVRWGPNSTKTEYSITGPGVEAFEQWMTRPIEYPVDRDPAHLRAAYFEWVDPRVAREQLEAHIAHFEGLRAVRLAQLVSIRDHTHPIVRRRLESADPDRARRLVAFKAFTYEGFVELAECEIAWAKRGIRLLDELAAEERTRPDEARD